MGILEPHARYRTGLARGSLTVPVPFPTLNDIDWRGHRLVVREDFNVPLEGGRVRSEARLRAAVPTLRLLLEGGARVACLSHLGRPHGVWDPALSLSPVADALSELLGEPVRLCANPGAVASGWNGTERVQLLENLRFFPGEDRDEEVWGRVLGTLGDVYVMDAFATAHRAQASTHSALLAAPCACAGPLLVREVEAITRAWENPDPPVLAVVGGAKVSTKFRLLGALVERVSTLLLGGGILNTMLAACGVAVGRSLHEPGEVDSTAALLERARARGVDVPLPVDVVVARALEATAEADVRPLRSVGADEMILDIGPETVAAWSPLCRAAGTVLWNGPLGVFEYPQFADGTRGIAEAVVQARGYTLAGGGDTLAALERFGLLDAVSYASTGGGAFLTFLEGGPMPALDALRARAT